MSAEQQPTGQDVTDKEAAEAIRVMGAATSVVSDPDVDDSLRGLAEHALDTLADRYNT